MLDEGIFKRRLELLLFGTKRNSSRFGEYILAFTPVSDYMVQTRLVFSQVGRIPHPAYVGMVKRLLPDVLAEKTIRGQGGLIYGIELLKCPVSRTRTGKYGLAIFLWRWAAESQFKFLAAKEQSRLASWHESVKMYQSLRREGEASQKSLL